VCYSRRVTVGVLQGACYCTMQVPGKYKAWRSHAKHTQITAGSRESHLAVLGRHEEERERATVKHCMGSGSTSFISRGMESLGKK